jgi:hypothetical protein
MEGFVGVAGRAGFVRSRFWILIAAVSWGVASLIAMLLSTGGHLSMPLDDAYIFFQYARRTAAGAPFSYQSGDPISSGATSLLTVLVDAVGYLVGFRGAAMSLFALLLGTACLAWAAHSSLVLGRRLAPRAAWLAPALLLVTGPLGWGFMSGMDLPLYVALALAFAAAWPAPGEAPARRLYLFGILLAFARPDALFLLVPALVFAAIGPRRRGWFLIGAAVVVPFLFCLLTTGSLMPASMDVKSVLRLPGFSFSEWTAGALAYLEIVLKGILGGGLVRDAQGVAANDGSGAGFFFPPLALVFLFAGLLPAAWIEARERKPGPALLLGAWAVCSLLAVSFTVPRGWHWYRYLMPIYAFLVPGLAAGADRAGRWLESVWPELRPPDGARALGGMLIVLSLPGTAYFLVAYGRNCADIYFQHIQLAERFRESRPVKPRLLGLHDAGALTYFSGVRTLDLEGLVSPDFRRSARLGSAGIWETLERLPAAKRPDVLALYPSWFDPAFLQPHHQVDAQRLFRPSIAAGNPLNVYLADWSLVGRDNEPTDSALVAELGMWMQVDAVDVADLESEAEARYRYHVLDGAYDSPLRLLKDGRGEPLEDGGRLVSGWEEFTARNLRKGDQVLLVTRSHAPFRLHVEANGRDAGIWVESAGEAGRWLESAFALPTGAVQGSEVRIRITSDDPHHSAYGSFHYWVYRR